MPPSKVLLLLSPGAAAAIRELRKNAVNKAAENPADLPLEAQILEIKLGPEGLIHRVSYAIYPQPATTWHHLTIALKDSAAQLPSPLVIAELMKAFDFAWSLRLPPKIPPVMAAGGYAMIRSARELPLVYRAAEDPMVVNVVEPFLQGRKRQPQV